MERNADTSAASHRRFWNMNPNFLWNAIIDGVILIAVVAADEYLVLSGPEPTKRGFFCNDESIRYPYRKSTVSMKIVVGVGLALPCCAIIVGEMVSTRNAGKLGRTRIPIWVVKCCGKLGVFLFGAFCTQLITEICKFMLGRLRPHFIAVCQPNINCSQVVDQHSYITDYHCQSSFPPRKLKNACKSFPSGHSSFTSYCLLYLAIYIHKRVTWRGSGLLRHFIQLCCVLVICYVGLSRIVDNYHHWSDVAGGLLLGSTAAILVAAVVSEPFQAAVTSHSSSDAKLIGPVKLLNHNNRQSRETPE